MSEASHGNGSAREVRIVAPRAVKRGGVRVGTHIKVRIRFEVAIGQNRVLIYCRFCVFEDFWHKMANVSPKNCWALNPILNIRWKNIKKLSFRDGGCQKNFPNPNYLLI